MRRSIEFLLVLTLCCLPEYCFAQDVPDTKADGFAGHVKRVRYEESARSDLGDALEASSPTTTVEIAYDPAGNRLELTHYMPDGSSESRTTDKDGRLSKVDSYGRDGRLSGRLVYLHGADGRVSDESYYSATGELQFKKLYSYSGDGRRVEKITYNNGGKDRDRTEITSLDPAGNVTEESVYNLSGSLITKVAYQYDNRSMLSGLTITSGPDEQILSRVIYRRDSDSRVIGTSSYGVGGRLLSNATVAYDAAGNRSSSMTFNPDGTLKELQTWRYDEKANELEYRRSDAQGAILESISHNYEYDSHGNWVKDSQQGMKSQGQVRVIKKLIARSISYY